MERDGIRKSVDYRENALLEAVFLSVLKVWISSHFGPKHQPNTYFGSKSLSKQEVRVIF